MKMVRGNWALLLWMVALAPVVCLTACTPAERAVQEKGERDLINEKLPRGCVMRDLGEYAEIRHVIVVTCKGSDTTTTSASWRCGKSCVRNIANTVIGNEE
jgi:hypothetical protein